MTRTRPATLMDSMRAGTMFYQGELQVSGCLEKKGASSRRGLCRDWRPFAGI